MTEPMMDKKQVELGTQAFLVLCQLFDGCYDELITRPELQRVTETIAAELLNGVAFLKEQPKPPKQVTIALALPELFFLQKLLKEMLENVPEVTAQPKSREWLEECLNTLGRTVLQ
ncbi:UNVERIFIED_CONTAM: hypothetical protein ABID98_001313 [Brevibacillus sp. OAP136]